MAAAREVMPGMLRIVWMLTDIATMISPARAAAAPAVATKKSLHPSSISTTDLSRSRSYDRAPCSDPLHRLSQSSPAEGTIGWGAPEPKT